MHVPNGFRYATDALRTAAVDEVRARHADLGSRIGEVMPAAIAAASPWYIPGPIKDAII